MAPEILDQLGSSFDASYDRRLEDCAIEIPVLSEARSSEFLIVVGRQGSGKTALCRLLGKSGYGCLKIDAAAAFTQGAEVQARSETLGMAVERCRSWIEGVLYLRNDVRHLMLDDFKLCWRDDDFTAVRLHALLVVLRETAVHKGVRCTIFLDSSIYDRIPGHGISLSAFRDSERRLGWSDRSLMELVARRIAESPEQSTDEVWRRCFGNLLDSEPASRFVLRHALPLPRDVLQLSRLTIQESIQGDTYRVSESAVRRAIQTYSRQTLDDVRSEYAALFPSLGFFFDIVGGRSCFHSVGSLLDLIASRQSSSRFHLQEIIQDAYRAGVLGIRRPGGGAGIYSFMEASNGPTIEDDEFVVHPAFRAALSLSP